MGKDGFRYFVVCTGIYLALAGAEFFLFRPLLDFFGTGVWTPVIVYIVLLLIADPLLTRFISDQIGFKELNKDEEGTEFIQ